MSKRATRVLAAVVGLLILIAGLAYTVGRSTEYKSEASLLLAPKKGASPDVTSSLLDSFQRSGTSGTYVELISSKDTLNRANAAGVSVAVRSVPDARTIQVEATGPEALVQPGLTRIIQAAQDREGELGDVWRLRVLASPSAPTVAGIGSKSLIAATIVLALLAALFVLVVLGRYRFAPIERGPAAELPGGEAEAAAAMGGVSIPLRAPGGAGELEQQAEVRVRFDLESFRYVNASATTVLLQVTGYWRSDYPRKLAVPTLLLHDGMTMHPLAPLQVPPPTEPESGQETPLWRGSYAAPVEIFDRHERIALRAGPGVVIGLPHPIEQGLLAGSQSADAAAPNGAGPDEEHDVHGDTDEFERLEPEVEEQPEVDEQPVAEEQSEADEQPEDYRERETEPAAETP
jgi:hypothetical protein